MGAGQGRIRGNVPGNIGHPSPLHPVSGLTDRRIPDHYGRPRAFLGATTHVHARQHPALGALHTGERLCL